MRTFEDYTFFIPSKYQSCIVRDLNVATWEIAVCAGHNEDGDAVFFSGGGMYRLFWMQYLPLNHITILLIGTDKSYAELVKELNGIIEPGQK